MRFDDCPVCKGCKEVVGIPLFGIVSRKNFPEDYKGDVLPCDYCQDDNGNPTGRVCVMGDGELEALKCALRTLDKMTTPTNHWERKMLTATIAELTHRKEGGGK
jgi:hypothetical protein